MEANILALRKRAGLTQDELARTLGVSTTTIRNWENSRHAMEWFLRVARLCNALNCDPSDLVSVQLETESEE